MRATRVVAATRGDILHNSTRQRWMTQLYAELRCVLCLASFGRISVVTSACLHFGSCGMSVPGKEQSGIRKMLGIEHVFSIFVDWPV